MNRPIPFNPVHASILAMSTLLAGACLIALPTRNQTLAGPRAEPEIVLDKSAPESVRVQVLKALHRGW